MERNIAIDPRPSTIEWIEKEAWLDMYSAAPSSVAEAFNLRSTSIAETPALGGTTIPISEFNRAFMMDDLAKPPIAAVTEWLRENSAPDFAIQLAAAEETAELQVWARQHGFEPAGNGWSKLIRNIGLAGDEDFPKNERLTLNIDPDPELYGNVVVSSMGLPKQTGEWFSALVGRPNWYVAVVLLDGEAVGSGALFVKDQWAWFGIDGTLENARRQGIQTALIQARVEMARKLGALYLTAETGRPEDGSGKHTSRDNYMRNGFTEAYHRLNFKTI